MKKDRDDEIERGIRTHLDEIVQDVRYALRTLRKSLGFTTIAVLHGSGYAARWSPVKLRSRWCWLLVRV